MAYPLLTVLLSLVWCVGTMAYAHVPISIVSTVLPVLLVAVGSAYGIHLIHHFQNEAVGRADPRTAGKYTLDVVGSGVFMAGLTTMAGFGSLGFNRIVPLRDFGLFIGVGVFYALMLSLYMVMALLMRFGGRAKPARKPAECKTQNHLRRKDPGVFGAGLHTAPRNPDPGLWGRNGPLPVGGVTFESGDEQYLPFLNPRPPFEWRTIYINRTFRRHHGNADHF